MYYLPNIMELTAKQILRAVPKHRWQSKTICTLCFLTAPLEINC